jgi:hypothetical protein
MKRERIVRAIEKSHRHLGAEFCRAKVRVRVSAHVVTVAECYELARKSGVKDAQVRAAGAEQSVTFKFKIFSRADAQYRAKFLIAWFKSIKSRGARVTSIDAVVRSPRARRARRRQRRLSVA